jgi:argininosuccinate lyase
MGKPWHAEGLIDDLHLLKAAYTINDSNPLGTAAGYGNSFPLDRQFTTDLLNFKNLVVSPVNAQITRGKLEKTISFAISSVASTLSKLSMDIVLFSGENFGFFDIERKFTTGSSIMPHKKNPDGFELIRGYCNQIQSLPYEISLVVNNLPSGYHRDFQVLKTHLFPAISKMKECLNIMIKMIESLEVSEGLLDDQRYEQIFSVENVNKLVQSGHSFRDAYKILALQIEAGEYKPEKELKHTHIGSIGNLSNDLIVKKFNEAFFLDTNQASYNTSG